MYDLEVSLDDQILGFAVERPTVVFTESCDPRRIAGGLLP